MELGFTEVVDMFYFPFGMEIKLVMVGWKRFTFSMQFSTLLIWRFLPGWNLDFSNKKAFHHN
jgi:hypothetical protein